ncbi:P-loop NTPase family protein [Mucilaginibacter lappiensis]|uniref:AAA domain-containing protein n=1 Tax=Mucilaginibacter lappiensis TaxID=354630 RepID=A0A841J874_9SPHI|nr:hypothetical protein [Mucilaginibacter lappiensis]MBB6126950.1 hypothetical protein [Mucilaginibacter lappiensis]
MLRLPRNNMVTLRRIPTPDLVVVDGIRDLVFDINNPEEATNRTGDLMRWAEIYDCHILNILHQNKGNEHARGHLGTEMINKSESVIKVEVGEDKFIICSPEYTRSAPFEPFAFDRDSDGMPVIVTGFSGSIATSGGTEGKKKTVDPTDPNFNSAHIEIVDKCFSKEEYLKYDDVVRNIKHYFQLNGVELGINKAKEFLTHYIQTGIIWKNPYVKGFAKYQKNPKFEGFPYFAGALTPTTGKEAPF